MLTLEVYLVSLKVYLVNLKQNFWLEHVILEIISLLHLNVV